MTYYRVNSAFDNVQIIKNRKISGFLVANELYTEKELEKLLNGARLRGHGIKATSQAFEKVEINKNKTYWFFGARFESAEA